MSTPARFGMRIGGIAGYAPRNKITNSRIAARLRKERMTVNAENLANGLDKLDRREEKLYKTNDRWIQRFIGFKERRFAADGEGTIDLAARAAQLLMHEADLRPNDIDGILFGTVTPSYLNSPPDAAILQDRLGIPSWNGDVPHECHSADMSLACSTWVSALQHAYLLISTGQCKNVMLIGADKMSSTINWRDRAFASVLGDAGTATWCTAVPPEEDWFGNERFWAWLSGKDGDIIVTPKGGSSHPVETVSDITSYQNKLTMDGRMVRELIVPMVGGPGIRAGLAKAGWTMDMLDVATLHEANLVLNDEIIKMWKEQGFAGTVISADGLFGNTTAATIPLAVSLHPEAYALGKKFVWFAFGGGLSAVSVMGEIKHPLITAVSV